MVLRHLLASAAVAGILAGSAVAVTTAASAGDPAGPGVIGVGR